MSRWFTLEGATGSVPIDDRGFAYGDGLFETVAIRGGSARLWHRHLERLSAGCERLGLSYPGDAQLGDLLALALEASDADGVVKLVLTAGHGKRGYARQRGTPSALYAGVFERPDYPPSADVRICRTRLAQQPALAGLKTLNRLEQVLGRSELDREFEGLMCDQDDRLICGTMSNVILSSATSLVTPSLDRCGVAGVARAELLERARLDDVAIDVADVPAERLASFDAIVLVNSQFGVMPVRRIGDRKLDSSGTAATLARLLEPAGFGAGHR